MNTNKWKPRPSSYPDKSPEYVSAADLNQFFDTRDTEVAGSSLQRDESFAESTHSDSDRTFQPKKNLRFGKARDSIFHYRQQRDEDEDDEEDEDSIGPNETVQEIPAVTLRNTNTNTGGTNPTNRISQVRFSSLPNENEEYTNAGFVDDHGNELDSEQDPKGSTIFATQQKPEWENEEWAHWNTGNSSEDDDE